MRSKKLRCILLFACCLVTCLGLNASCAAAPGQQPEKQGLSGQSGSKRRSAATTKKGKKAGSTKRKAKTQTKTETKVNAEKKPKKPKAEKRDVGSIDYGDFMVTEFEVKAKGVKQVMFEIVLQNGEIVRASVPENSFVYAPVGVEPTHIRCDFDGKGEAYVLSLCDYVRFGLPVTQQKPGGATFSFKKVQDIQEKAMANYIPVSMIKNKRVYYLFFTGGLNLQGTPTRRITKFALPNSVEIFKPCNLSELKKDERLSLFAKYFLKDVVQVSNCLRTGSAVLNGNCSQGAANNNMSFYSSAGMPMTFKDAIENHMENLKNSFVFGSTEDSESFAENSFDSFWDLS